MTTQPHDDFKTYAADAVATAPARRTKAQKIVVTWLMGGDESLDALVNLVTGLPSADDAALLIQMYLGITDGGIASMWLTDKAWDESQAGRASLLRMWIADETAH